MGITIYDVSKLSGVSTATISRVFSDPSRVREETRRKVFEAAAALHYSPNAIASSMARQRTDKIAFLICKKSATIMDEFYAGICNGIMQETNLTEYQLLISTEDDWRKTVGNAKTKQIEGVILGGFAGTELISEFRSRNIPVVLVNNKVPGGDLPCVISDEYGGIREAIRLFTEKGHKNIGMVTGRFSPYISGERYKAFATAMKEFGLPVSVKYMRMCDPDIESAVKAATGLLTGEERPDAIFGGNDIIAAGIIKAAIRLGIRIPEELAVIGCDDSLLCSVTEPELTSIHINCFRMGEMSVKKLIGILDKNGAGSGTDIVAEELHIRNSV